MATQPTNLPVPSESYRDLKFNAGRIDEFVTSLAQQYIDRFGNAHYTIEGLRWLAQQAIAQYGWIPSGTFQDGATLTLPNQILKDTTDGEFYRWDGSFLPAGKVVNAGSTPSSSGGVGVGAWLSVGDSVLRSQLATSTPANVDALIGGLSGRYGQPYKFVVVDNYPYNGNLKAALAAAVPGNVFICSKKTYNITGLYATTRNTVENITIIGAGMPEISSDKSRFVDGSGTVIQGAVKNQAKGFKIYNLGVDCGNYVSQNLYSTTTYEDAVQIYGVGNDANIELDNVKTLNSLGISSNPPTHAILLEALSGVTLGYVECIGGFHGLTLKCENLRGGRAHCYMQYGEGFIFKSDSGAVCRSIHMDSITVGLANTSGWPVSISNGGLYDAQAGIADIHIGKLNCIFASWLLVPIAGAPANITQVTIGEICAIETYGNYFAVELSGKCVNWTIGYHQFSGVSGGIKISPNAANCGIGNGSVTSSTTHGYSIGGDTNYHGTLLANGNSGYGVEYTGGVGFNPSIIIGYGNGTGNFSSLPSAVTGNPLNNWSIGTDFRAIPMGHEVQITGSFVRGSTSGANIIQLLPNMIPEKDTVISGFGTNSSGSAIFINLYVSTSGYLVCDNYSEVGASKPIKFNGTYLRK
ncbi:tail fiber/spike domain-containing protein [Enterobacter cloacae]